MTPYRPPFPSEKLLQPPPYRGCGLTSDWICYALATLGETTRKANGREKGQAAMRADLQTGWDAFEARPDDNGWIDQGDMPRIRDAMHPGLPHPALMNTTDTSRIATELKSGHAISIALKLSVLPASSPLRKYTSADHQVPLYGFKHVNGKGYTKRPDPMHPVSNAYTGEWVPLADVRKAAMGFGKVYSWVFPIGGWTAAALVTAAKDKRIDALVARKAALQARIVTLVGEVEQLTEQLTGCDDVDALLDALHVWEQSQR
jgi:hypothetical protein